MNKIIILLVIIIIGFAVYFVFCKEEVEAPLPEDSSPGFDIPFTGVKVNDALCAPFLSFPDCSLLRGWFYVIRAEKGYQ